MGVKRKNLTKLEKKVLEYYLALRHRKDVEVVLEYGCCGPNTKCWIFNRQGIALCMVFGIADFVKKQFTWNIEIPNSHNFDLHCEAYITTPEGAHSRMGEFMPVLEWAIERAFKEAAQRGACDYVDALMEETKERCK